MCACVYARISYVIESVVRVRICVWARALVECVGCESLDYKSLGECARVSGSVCVHVRARARARAFVRA